MFTVVFQQIVLVIKLFISKATDFWSFWIICWETNVNLDHFYFVKFVENFVGWPWLELLHCKLGYQHTQIA